MSKKRNYKHFIQTLKNYDLYITFRIWIIRGITQRGLIPNKTNIHFQIMYRMQGFSTPHWTTKRIIVFFNNVKEIYTKHNLFTINTTLTQ